MTFRWRLTGHVTPDDKARNDYFYAPFDLPLPATRLQVSYSYSAQMTADRITGGNVIDIGLFDPRGSGFPGGAGFRGWSGSARNAFWITPDQATPGYLPGPLPAGTYQIMLGLYRIQPAGADYTITIEADLDHGSRTTDHGLPIADDGPPSTNDRALTADFSRPPSIVRAQTWLWLRGDLQSHTEHSDARGTIAQLTAKARALGLDFLAITDHNTVSHHAHLAQCADHQLLLIPGQESTTYYGHMNIWGTSRWCDFRSRSSDDMARVIALAHQHDALCSINHPKQGGPAWEYETDLPVDAIEVWQGPWPNRNTESLALWDRLLTAGRRLPAVGGSDYHCPAGAEQGFLRLGQPTTWVKAHDRSVGAILDAIRAGRASMSYIPDGPRLDLRASLAGNTAGMGETLIVSHDQPVMIEVDVERGAGWTLQVIADGQVIHQARVTAKTTVTCAAPINRYVRAELVGDAPADVIPPDAPAELDRGNWRWAISNPVYIAHQHQPVES